MYIHTHTHTYIYMYTIYIYIYIIHMYKIIHLYNRGVCRSKQAHWDAAPARLSLARPPTYRGVSTLAFAHQRAARTPRYFLRLRVSPPTNLSQNGLGLP